MDKKYNVLFGTLAVQYRLVTPRQLQPVAQQWAADPSRDLPEYLSDANLIAAKDIEFVASAVDRAINSHGGDSDAAIKACGGADSIFEFVPSFTATGRSVSSGINVDDLLHAESARPAFNSVAATTPVSSGAHNVGSDGGVRVGHTPNPPSRHAPPPRSAYVEMQGERPQAVVESEGRYNLIEEYARGGMGRVLLVHDQYIGRDIALKELLPERAGKGGVGSTPTPQTNPILARFVQEARITGQLEHPAIVPVYELGYRQDGTLYYTMKLVRGRTMARALKQCEGLRDRLALLSHFVDLCQAIAYAHSRKVIHRDLKPGNVMVGEFGETVVIDWGLAKIQGHKDDAAQAMSDTIQVFRMNEGAEMAKTQQGLAMGTPAYMAPEQARGDIESVGEQSDVYALGAVLYELLTGQPPYVGKTSREILDLVLTQEPVPIDAVEPDAPPELVAICRRAMQRKPQSRYATAKELAEEVTRFLSGALVSAYEYTAKEQVVRYVRRHRAILATAAAGLLVVLAIGVMYNVRLIAANVQLRETNQLEQSAREEAVAAQKAADDALGLARQNYAVARQAIDRLCTELSENELLAAPGLSPIRTGLLREALVYYRQFASAMASAPQAPGMQRDLVEAYLRVADVAHTVGEDSEAVRAYEEAQEFLARLTEADPDNPDYVSLRALALHNIAKLQEDKGDYDAALASNQNALQLRQMLLEQDSENTEYKRGLADSYNNLALLHKADEDLVEAATFSQSALDLRWELVESDPMNNDLRKDLALSFNNHGLLKIEENLSAAALDAFNSALKIQDELVTQQPGNAELLEEQARTRANIANLHYDEDRFAEAEPWIQQAATTFERLHELYPAVLQYRTNLATGYTTLGLVLRKQERMEDALVPMEEALRIRKEMSEEYTDRDNRLDLAHAYFNYGLLLIDLGRPDESIGALNEALRLHYELAQEAPESVEDYEAFQYKLVMTQAQFQFANKLAGESKTRKEADEKFQLALSHIDALSNEYPDYSASLVDYRSVVQDGYDKYKKGSAPPPKPKAEPKPEPAPVAEPTPAPQPVQVQQAPPEEEKKDPLGRLFRGVKKKFSRDKRN